MNLFINDIPIRILKPRKKPEPGDINHAIDAKTEPITKAKLMNRVWVRHATINEGKA